MTEACGPSPALRAFTVLLVCLTACPRRAALPDVPSAIPTTDVPSVVVDAAIALADVHVPMDVPARRPHRPSLAGAWRHMPRVTTDAARVLATWDEPPDLDGDDLPDAVSAIAWDPRTTTCTSSDDDHPCPTLDPNDSGGNDQDGPLLVAYVTFLTGEATVDAGRVGRLVGTRRLWQATSDVPITRLMGFEFAEFGPGVTIRSTLASRTAHGEDTLDVVDLFTGAGLDRHAGAIAQHCTRLAGQTPTRSGTIAVEAGGLAPLVWRAAQGHPFSGCETNATDLDASLGASLARGATVTLASTAHASTRARVVIQMVDNTLRAVAANSTVDPDGGTVRTDPLTAGGLTVQEMLRGCTTDRVRYTLDGHHCEFQVPRDDGALPGCEDHTSPLDPRPPRAVCLNDHDGGTDLLFTRGGTALSVAMPARCSHGGTHTESVPWHGPLPSGLSVSPEGTRVLAANGFDLWLYAPGRRAPVLLNPPGGPLPRGTVRAVAFADAGHAAAVIAEDFVVFQITLTDDEGGPSELRVDPSELSRPFHGS